MLIVFTTGAWAQSITREWLGLSYEVIERDKSQLVISQMLRWQGTTFQQAITEADFKTDLIGAFSAGMELRYSIDKDREGAIKGNRSGGRIRLNLYHSAHVGKLELDQRAGIQYFRRFDDGANRLTFRFRPQLTPKIKNFKHDPSFSVEYFKVLETGGSHSFRYGIGVPFNFDKNRLELGYYFEQNGDPLTSAEHIFSLKYKRTK
ncbi:DUF2490 domain-containing protein [Robiginitalea sp.]|nr:DUF2490 domain-containing protein [Robiginitalea sp.]